MIPSIHLKDLWRITMRRSTLITIPDLKSFFEFNNEFTHWEVFYGIVRDALDKFQYYYPLYRQQKIYLNVQNGKAELRGNFEGYLKGAVSEDQIVLLPGSVLGLGSGANQVGLACPIRNYHYEVGLFTDIQFSSGVWWMSCLCYRPFPEEFDQDGQPSVNCRVYWMNKDNDVEFKIFKDQIYVELCRYIANMKKNMQLNDLPIDVFSGLDEDSQRVNSDLEKIYDGALTASPWLI